MAAEKSAGTVETAPLYTFENRVIVFASGKGGVGKTLLTQVFASFIEVNEQNYQIIQIDDQQKLRDLYDGRVKTIELAQLEGVMRDSKRAIRAFDVLFDALDDTQTGDVTSLIDIAATRQHAFFEYAKLVDLPAILEEQNRDIVFVVPVLAERESVEQAADIVLASLEVFPSSSLVVALNERDGEIDLQSDTTFRRLWQKRLGKTVGAVTTMKIPRLEPDYLTVMEATSVRLADVPAMSPEKLIEIGDFSKGEARIVRADFRRWIEAVYDEIRRVFYSQAARD